jgi:hypothetical protein
MESPALLQATRINSWNASYSPAIRYSHALTRNLMRTTLCATRSL